MNNELKEAIQEQLLTYKSEAPQEAIYKFSAMDEEELVMCHFGLGLYIRNHYLLPESKLYKCFVADGVTCKDDMSDTIIRMWHDVLSKELKSKPDSNDRNFDFEEEMAMNGQQIIVDRIENGLAVCEIDGVFKDIPLSQINGSVHEGDKLYFDEGSAQYMVDKKGTEERQNLMSNRFKSIKK